jgi:hypothetical protein
LLTLTLFATVLTASAARAVPAHGLALRVVGLDHGGFARDQLYNGFGCTGANRSPELRIGDVPAAAKSLAVTMYDPDAPTGSGWWHWQVFDLPTSTRRLAEGAGTAGGRRLPAGARQSRNDFSARGFGGACPPQGDHPHRYQITLFALSVPTLDAAKDASAALVGFNINASTIARRTVTVRYGRR